jgi:hypothetical protein
MTLRGMGYRFRRLPLAAREARVAESNATTSKETAESGFDRTGVIALLV